jgi:hypothetical protein
MNVARLQLTVLTLLLLPAIAWSAEKTVYRCPGKPVLYTDALSSKEANEKGCTSIEGTPITIISSQKTNAGNTRSTSSSSVVAPRSTSAGPDSQIDPSQQRVRDNDARKILEAELRKEEETLAQLKKEYNQGEPERRGDEANYQKYLDRLTELKANLTRKEGDVAALRRELGKLP